MKRGRRATFSASMALGLRAQGKTAREIAQLLHVSEEALRKFFSRQIKKNQLARLK